MLAACTKTKRHVTNAGSFPPFVDVALDNSPYVYSGYDAEFLGYWLRNGYSIPPAVHGADHHAVIRQRHAECQLELLRASSVLSPSTDGDV